MRLAIPVVAIFLAACDGSSSASKVLPPTQRGGASELQETQRAAGSEKGPLPSDPSIAIKRILALKTPSYHVFLREASLVVPPLLRGRSWDDVAALMKELGFPAIEAWSNGDAVHSYHRVAEKFVAFPGGKSLDLYLLLSAPNLNRGSFDAKPGGLYAAHVALVADPRASWSELVENKQYPEDTIIGKALAAVPELGKEWPLIRRIYVYYDLLWNRWMEWSPSGFVTIVEFAASLEEKIGGMNQWLYASSGLDPMKSRDGGVMPGQAWKSADTLGEVDKRGSNQWWHGDKETVERNREKYLKRRK